MHPFYDQLTPVIGHRGACGHCPENTLSSLIKAKELGCQWVEIDVVLSEDGVPVIFHDDELSRCSNGSGLVLKSKSDYLLGLDAGSWFSEEYRNERILTLEQALKACLSLGLYLNLEIKSHLGWEWETVEAISPIINQLWPADYPLILSSFNPDALVAANQLLPKFPRGLNIDLIPRDWHEKLTTLNCNSLHFYAPFANAERIQAAKAAGYKVFCFTVNDIDEANSLYSLGVDTVFCDFPERLIP